MSFADDYAAVRHDVAARLVPRDVLAVRGPDARSYLQGQCTQDIDALAVGGVAESLLLSPQGKVDAYVRVTRTAAEEFVLDTEGGFGPAVRARLERFKLRVKAEIEELTWTCVSVRGPGAPAAADVTVAHGLALGFSWGSVGGVDVLGQGVTLPEGVHPCGAAAWEAVRVEAGIPVMGAELDERTIVAEAGLLDRCVSFTKGCYTGQELVARLDSRGNRVARHLRGVVLGGELPADPADTLPVVTGAELVVGAKVVGTVTSSAWSPSLGAVALGYVHRDVTPPADVELRVTGEPGRAATVRELPLV